MDPRVAPTPGHPPRSPARSDLAQRALEWITTERARYLVQLTLEPPEGFASVERVQLLDPVDRRPLTAHTNAAGKLAVCWRPRSGMSAADAPWGDLALRLAKFVEDRRKDWAAAQGARACTQNLNVPKRELPAAFDLAPLDWTVPRRIDRLVEALHDAVTKAACSPDAHRATLIEFAASDRVRLDVMAVFGRAGYVVMKAPLDAQRRDLSADLDRDGRVRAHSVVVRIAEPYPRGALQKR